MITLTVRAYDLGIPSLESEVPVHIFTEETSSRTMRFIIDEAPDRVEREEDKVRYSENSIFSTIPPSQKKNAGLN